MRFLKRNHKFDLLYAPNLYVGDIGMYPLSNDTQYYKWQDMLWTFFKSRKDKIFIWKAGPSRTNYFDDPIKYRKADNIVYSTRSLDKELQRTKKVFVDFPSTVLHEALKMHIPSLCITTKHHEYILSQYMGKYSIYCCDNEYLILQMIGNFLDDCVRVNDLQITNDITKKLVELIKKRI